MLLVVQLACRPADSPLEGVAVIVDPARGEHFFDVPFPSDGRLGADGRPSLAGFPEPPQGAAADVVRGWAERVTLATRGFANNGAAYFRFEAPVDVPALTLGGADDPVVWVAMDGSERLPVVTRFVADPAGDPFWGPNTLAITPALGHPMRSGGQYAAVIMRAAGARAPEGYVLPEGVVAALDAAGVRGEPVVATVFTVGDATAELRALFADVDGRLAAAPPIAPFKRVSRVRYAAGLTPSGKDAMVFTATYAEGGEGVAYLALDAGLSDHELDLGDLWPMAVFEGEIPVLNYQGLADRPYMSAGLAHLGDTDEHTGWIVFDGEAPPTPEWEWMRVTVSIPKDADGAVRADVPFVLWDHGTSGHAYNAVQRRNVADDGPALAAIWADAGVAVVGRDASLYGTRYPLIDEGYGGSLGYYNIVNPPAFRDNQRQTAVDGHALLATILGGALDDALPEGPLSPIGPRRFGHSLGSVTANLGLAAEPDAFDAAFVSGSGGVFSHYFLDTGLIPTLDPGIVASLFALADADVPEEVTATAALGAILGLPEEAWGNVDRMHPVVQLFQWQMDASDPMSVARDIRLPVRMIVCTGDLQVPNFTSEALLEAMPDASAYTVAPTSTDYDPHVCLHREVPGRDGLAEWLATR